MHEVIRPQPGPQTALAACTAKFCLFGGGVGGGKSFGSLLLPLRWAHVPHYQAVFFRRQRTNLVNSGGLWKSAQKLYGDKLGLEANLTRLSYKLPKEGEIRFAHLNDQKEQENWKGAEIDLIVFDEVTEFLEEQMWYMVTRNRSTSPAPKLIRMTCNPDADSWTARLLDCEQHHRPGCACGGYLDADGFPDPNKSGKTLFFARKNDEVFWGRTRSEVNALVGEAIAQSFTFIPSKLSDNKILEEINPEYRTDMAGALIEVERARLLGGNWRVRARAGDYFRKRDFIEHIVEATATADGRVSSTTNGRIVRKVRHWDLAATVPTPESPDPDFTAGVLMGVYENGRWCVLDVVRGRWRANERDEIIRKTAIMDGREVQISIPQDPGAAGKVQIEQMTRFLAPHRVIKVIESGDKVTRITPFASQCQAGNVDILRGSWNEDFFTEGEGFPKRGHDDSLDAATNAWLALAKFNRLSLL